MGKRDSLRPKLLVHKAHLAFQEPFPWIVLLRSKRIDHKAYRKIVSRITNNLGAFSSEHFLLSALRLSSADIISRDTDLHRSFAKLQATIHWQVFALFMTCVPFSCRTLTSPASHANSLLYPKEASKTWRWAWLPVIIHHPLLYYLESTHFDYESILKGAPSKSHFKSRPRYYQESFS